MTRTESRSPASDTGIVTFVHTSDWELNCLRKRTVAKAAEKNPAAPAIFKDKQQEQVSQFLSFLRDVAENPPTVMLLAGDLWEGSKADDFAVSVYREVLARLKDINAAGSSLYFSLATHDMEPYKKEAWRFFFDGFPGKLSSTRGFDHWRDSEHHVVALGGLGGNEDRRLGDKCYTALLETATNDPELADARRARFLVSGTNKGVSPKTPAPRSGRRYRFLDPKMDYIALGGYEGGGGAVGEPRKIHRPGDNLLVSVQGTPVFIDDVESFHVVESKVVIGYVDCNRPTGPERVRAELVLPSLYGVRAPKLWEAGIKISDPCWNPADDDL